MKTSVLFLSCQGGEQPSPRTWYEGAQGVDLMRHRGLVVIDTVVRNGGHVKKALSRVRSQKPALLVLQCEEADGVGMAMELLADLGKAALTLPVAVVGAHASLAPEAFLFHRAVDALIPGRWQEPATALGAMLVNKGTLGGVTGVLLKIGGNVAEAAPWEMIAPPGEWPVIEPAVLHGEEIAAAHGHVLPIRASHGFPFRGLFHADVLLRHLTTQPTYHHTRPISRLMEEAVRLRDAHKLVAFKFIDEIFPWDDKWLVAFAGHWAKEVNRPFSIRSCAEHLRRQRLDVLAEAGLQRVTISLEAGCERLRERHSNLNITNALVGDVIAACAEHGVEVCLEVLLGTAGESLKTLAETSSLVRTLAPHEIRPRIYDFPPGDDTWRRHVAPMADKPLPTLPGMESDLLVNMQAVVKQLVEEGAALRGRYLAQQSVEDPEVVHSVFANLGEGEFHTPWEEIPSHDVRWFHAPDGSKPVLAMRVPGQYSQMVDFPDGAVLRFSILLEPRPAGERFHDPVSFVVKVEQGGKNYKLFQKVLVQALDPDSRRWHHFSLPVTGIKAGLARLKLEVYLTAGGSKSKLPGDGAVVRAGWAGLEICARNDLAPLTPLVGSSGSLRSSGSIRTERMTRDSGDIPAIVPLRLITAKNDRIAFPETLSAETEKPFGPDETPQPTDSKPVHVDRLHRVPGEPDFELPKSATKIPRGKPPASRVDHDQDPKDMPL